MPSSITEIIYPHQEELVRKAIEEAEMAFLKAEKARLGSHVTETDVEQAMARARSSAFMKEDGFAGSAFDPTYEYDNSLHAKRVRPAKRKYVEIPDASDRTYKKRQSPPKADSHTSSPSLTNPSEPEATKSSDTASNSKGKHSSLTASREAPKKTLQPQKGGKMAAIWADYYNQLVDYKNKFGHVNVSATDPEYKQLAWWLYRQRTAYKSTLETGKGGMTRDRIQLLEALGMVWTTGTGSGGGIRTYQRKKGVKVPVVVQTNSYSSKEKDGEVSWMDRFQELKHYRRKYGTCNVSFQVNTSLARWAQRQREAYKEFRYQGAGTMTIEKVALLESIGMQFD